MSRRNYILRFEFVAVTWCPGRNDFGALIAACHA